MKELEQLIIKNWRTSLAGFVILICLCFLGFGILDSTEFCAIVAAISAAGLFYAKDGARMLLLCIATGSVLFISSCVTRKACARKYPPVTSEVMTEKTVYKDTLITIHGDTVRDTILLFKLVDSAGRVAPFAYDNVKGRARLKLSTTSDGKLAAECDCDTASILLTKIHTFRSNATTHASTIYKTPEWVWPAVALLFIVSLIEFALLRLKLK